MSNYTTSLPFVKQNRTTSFILAVTAVASVSGLPVAGALLVHSYQDDPNERLIGLAQ